MRRAPGLLLAGVLVALGTLAGCSVSGEDQLRQWMTEQKSQTRPRVAPISEPKQFKPENYTQASAMEPFSNQKLTKALRRESTQASANGALIAPELARRKEELERFPLDGMTLVGTLSKSGQPVALVKVENMLYQVRVGSYLGQNYGRVSKITETEVTLREVVQDAIGEWIERKAALQLQERSK
jgi:type IV pilus assembly protein PilP